MPPNCCRASRSTCSTCNNGVAGDPRHRGPGRLRRDALEWPGPRRLAVPGRQGGNPELLAAWTRKKPDVVPYCRLCGREESTDVNRVPKITQLFTSPCYFSAVRRSLPGSRRPMITTSCGSPLVGGLDRDRAELLVGHVYLRQVRTAAHTEIGPGPRLMAHALGRRKLLDRFAVVIEEDIVHRTDARPVPRLPARVRRRWLPRQRWGAAWRRRC